MIPSRFFYSEKLSKIPNIFQLRSKENGSHFTALRILKFLQKGQEGRSPPFVPVAKIAFYFVETFSMKEDFHLNMDVLLKHHLIETNNRLDVFNDQVDSVRITTYGQFMLSGLSTDFTYLELVSEDCALGSAEVAASIAEQSNDEYRFFIGRKAMERVEVRLERADTFINYLAKEEEREILLYHLPTEPEFSKTIHKNFEREKLAVLKSARRNVRKKNLRGT